MTPIFPLHHSDPSHPQSIWPFPLSALWSADPKRLSQPWVELSQGAITCSGMASLFILSALLYLPTAYLCALVINHRKGRKPTDKENVLLFHMKHGGPFSGLFTWMLFVSIELWQGILCTLNKRQLFILVLVRTMAIAAITHIGLTVLFVTAHSILRKFGHQGDRGTHEQNVKIAA